MENICIGLVFAGTGSFRPESRSPPESFRPYSRSFLFFVNFARKVSLEIFDKSRQNE
jgi:hypothetical protein